MARTETQDNPGGANRANREAANRANREAADRPNPEATHRTNPEAANRPNREATHRTNPEAANRPNREATRRPNPEAPKRPLDGRVAVVTGATSGIGAATARRLAAEGAAVAIVGRREQRLRELADGLAEGAGNALPIAADVSDPASFARAARRVRDELGPVDLVVANAGAMLAAPFEEADTAEWDRMLDTNVRGLLYTGRAFADDLIAAAGRGERADLVHIGSIGGHWTFPNYAVYGATKAAVAHLTRNLRMELGPRGVRVKTVEPGLVATELGDDMQHEAGRAVLTEMRETLQALDPAHIADAIAYAVALPAQVNVAELIVLPTAQG